MSAFYIRAAILCRFLRCFGATYNQNIKPEYARYSKMIGLKTLKDVFNRFENLF